MRHSGAAGAPPAPQIVNDLQEWLFLRDATVMQPPRMTDRWAARAEPGPGQAQVYWHIMMRDQPQVCALAALARHRLAGFSGLHFTPEERLHLSVLRVGLAVGIPASGLEAMASQARENLRDVPPATITIGKVGYHPEAIVLLGEADGTLERAAAAIRDAARDALSLPDDVATTAGWIPHVTVAYSTQDQPAEPLMAALGTELPACTITAETITLVAQHGPERDWNWQLLARLHLTDEPARPRPA